MGYTATIPDLFDLSGPLSNDIIVTHAGGEPTAPVTFGPPRDPLVFEIAVQGLVQRGDTVMLDGARWTVTGLADANINLLSGDALNPDYIAPSVIQTIRLSDGTTERHLAVELDDFVYPFTDPAGNPLTVDHFIVWSYASTFTLSIRHLQRDDPDRLRVVCFAAGTLIETATGPRPVQSLRVGDLVRTGDHGFQPLRWLGGRRLTGAELAAAPNLAPIRIAAGALGPGRPAQDLIVSPQHRLLLRSKIAARIAGVPEVLAAAVHLLDLPGVQRLGCPRGVAYWHLMLDRHEIVFANGAEAESLYPGPMALAALTPEARAEIVALFPDLAAPDAAPARPARPILRGGQIRRLVERQVRNRKPLVAALAP